MASIVDNFRRQVIATALREGRAVTLSGTFLNLVRVIETTFRRNERCIFFGLPTEEQVAVASRVIGPSGFLQLITVTECASKLHDHIGLLSTNIRVGWISGVRAELCCLDIDIEGENENLAFGCSGSAGFEASMVENPGECIHTQALKGGAFDAVLVDAISNREITDNFEIFLRQARRIIRPGGRMVLAISVSDEEPTNVDEDFPYITEGHLFTTIESQHFEALEVREWPAFPSEVRRGVEIRQIVLSAYAADIPLMADCNEAVIYRGPWQSVVDDQGNTFQRGRRTAVSHAVYQKLVNEPFRDYFIPVPPYQNVSLENAPPFISHGEVRAPVTTKGLDRKIKGESIECCNTDGCC